MERPCEPDKATLTGLYATQQVASRAARQGYPDRVVCQLAGGKPCEPDMGRAAERIGGGEARENTKSGANKKNCVRGVWGHAPSSLVPRPRGRETAWNRLLAHARPFPLYFRKNCNVYVDGHMQ